MPESYEIDLHAEMQRQAEWDDALHSCPKCVNCGTPVLAMDTYLEYEDIVLCEQCIDKFTLSSWEQENG